MEIVKLDNNNIESMLKDKQGQQDSKAARDDATEKKSTKKSRIVYDKDFLLRYKHKPSSAKKPLDLPFELTVLNTRMSGSPLNPSPLKRKEPAKKENGRQSPDDCISLRPHSGNFSSGCAPNFSPNHGPPPLNRFYATTDDQSKPFFDRDFTRNPARFPASRLDLGERVKGDREKGRDDRGRDERAKLDREERDKGRQRDGNYRERGTGNRIVPGPTRRNYGQGYNSWGSEAEQSDWNKRNSNGQGHYRRDYNERSRNSNSRGEEEPEWFSEGPMTHNDTIELRGFLDDERQDKGRHPLEDKKDLSKKRTANNTANEVAQTNLGKNESGDISIDKILSGDPLSTILPAGLLESSGSSRFSQLFQRNSGTPSRPESNGEANPRNGDNDEACLAFSQFGLVDERPDAVQSKAARDIEVALRNILLTKPIEEQEKEVENIHAFKKLLDQIVVKGGNKTTYGAGSPQTSQGQNVPNLLSTFASNPASPAQVPVDILDPRMSNTFGRLEQFNRPAERQTPPNPLEDTVFSNLLNRAKELPHNQARDNMYGQRKPPPTAVTQNRPYHPFNLGFAPPAGRQVIPQNALQIFQDQVKQQQQPRNLTPNEVVSLLPAEMRYLVANTNVGPDFLTRPEVVQIVQALTNGDIVLGEIIKQLASPNNTYKPLLAGVLRLSLQGIFPVPGLILAPMGMGPRFPPPPQQAAYQNFVPQQNAYYQNHVHHHQSHATHPTNVPNQSRVPPHYQNMGYHSGY